MRRILWTGTRRMPLSWQIRVKDRARFRGSTGPAGPGGEHKSGVGPAAAQVRPVGVLGLAAGRERVLGQAGQLIRLTHSAAIAKPCRTARGTIMRSQSRCSARALDGVWCSSAAAVSARLIGALTRR